MTAPSRKLGVWMATALVIGNILAAGILMLPGSLAPYGWNAVAGWLITMFGALCLAWVFAELARRLPDAGGANGFMRLGLGEGAAFLGSWGYLVSCWPTIAAIAITGVSYLTRLVPAVDTFPGGATAIALALISLLTWVNLRGLRTGGSVQLVTTIVKLLPFAAAIGLAFWRLFSTGGRVLAPITPGAFTFAGATSVASLTLYAMLGVECATVPSDAVENAERNVPRATIIGTVVSAVASIIATCAVVLMLPVDQVVKSNAPIADFIAVSWGNVAGGFVALCAVVSCFGAVNGWILISGQMAAVMADAGTLPPWFGKRNANGIPAQSVVLSGVIGASLTLLAATKAGVAAFNFVALLATATNLVMYLLCSIVAFKFMSNGRLPRTAGLTVASVGAGLFSVWAFYGSGWEAIAWGAALTAAGWPIYRLTRRRLQTQA